MPSAPELDTRQLTTGLAAAFPRRAEMEKGPVMFEYSPLRSNEIRLMRLQPGGVEDDVQFAIFHYSLEPPEEDSDEEWSRTERVQMPRGWKGFKTPEGRPFYQRFRTRSRTSLVTYKHPNDGANSRSSSQPGPRHPFEALSYTWGDSSHQQIAYISDTAHENKATQTLRIGHNLTVCLKHLRLKDAARTLWVDAVCINQGDLEERAAQVKRMRHIYGMASRVVVWLETSSADSGLALDLLQYLGKQLEISVDGWLFRSFDPEASEPGWFDKQTVLPYSETEWKAIESLFLRPYFSRLWVLQEVIANPNTIMICGADSIDWYYLRRAIVTLDERVGVPADLSYRLNNKVAVAYGCRNALREIIFIARQHLCQDPRDKIYGVLGLFGHDLRASISPSYERPSEIVYKELFLMHSNATRRLDLLTQCFVNDNSSKLPSWVPDLRFFPTEFRIPEPGYQASGASKAEFRERANSCLEVTGMINDEVVFVSQSADVDVESLIDHIRKLKPADLSTSQYVTGEQLLKAWIRTLAIDLLRERFPHHFFPSYAEWEKMILGILVESPDDAAISKIANLSNMVRDTWTDMCFFRTKNGYFGFGSSAMKSGDFVATLLGVPTPLIIRPSSQGTYQVIGWSYVHSLMDCEALLGPLPDGWIVDQRDIDLRYLPRYVNVHKNWWQVEDPRLGEVPQGWRRILDRKYTPDDPVVVDYFENEETGEIVNYDPRMTANALRSRGVELETLMFV